MNADTAEQHSQSVTHRTRRPLVVLAAGAALAGIVLLFSQQILWGIGAALVREEAPVKADIAVVLAGDSLGNRVLKAAEEARLGYVPAVLVSGAARYYSGREAEMAVDYAVSKGYPRENLIAFQNRAHSTVEEAGYVIPELRRRGVRRLLLVTSHFHTARATRVFHRMAPEIEIHTVGSSDPGWNNGYWWKKREGRKVWLEETTKTFADYLGGL